MTMRALLDWYLQWHPPIMHDLHESVPFLYTFSGQAPQNPSLDPILYGELPWFSNFEMAQMIKYGMPGVWTHAFVDMWSPGYLGFMASNHNGLLRMYETFGNGGANTMKRKVDAAEAPGGGQTTREWYRPLPPYKEVEWSMRNNTNYQETGVLSRAAAHGGVPEDHPRELLPEEPQRVEAGKKEAPFGFVIPAGQRDLTRGGIRARHPPDAGHRSGPGDVRGEAVGRHVPGRLVRHQARPALRPAREDPAREAGLPRRQPAHLRRQRLDDGADDRTPR